MIKRLLLLVLLFPSLLYAMEVGTIGGYPKPKAESTGATTYYVGYKTDLTTDDPALDYPSVDGGGVYDIIADRTALRRYTATVSGTVTAVHYRTGWQWDANQYARVYVDNDMKTTNPGTATEPSEWERVEVSYGFASGENLDFGLGIDKQSGGTTLPGTDSVGIKYWSNESVTETGPTTISPTSSADDLAYILEFTTEETP